MQSARKRNGHNIRSSDGASVRTLEGSDAAVNSFSVQSQNPRGICIQAEFIFTALFHGKQPRKNRSKLPVCIKGAAGKENPRDGMSGFPAEGRKIRIFQIFFQRARKFFYLFAECRSGLQESCRGNFARRAFRVKTGQQLNALNCMECGSCAWACPSRRNLTQSCRVAKRIINKRRKEAAAQKGDK